jgi:hypothetical protein
MYENHIDGAITLPINNSDLDLFHDWSIDGPRGSMSFQEAAENGFYGEELQEAAEEGLANGYSRFNYIGAGL